ncbi:hypothetical protein QCD71_01145 [Sphingomonas sp. PsM26]|nr:hypothetical protein [Sphingomonas sp. PsM26]
MTESIASLRHLKRQIAAIEQREGLCDSAVDTVRVGTGHDGIDQAIGGGLARGRLHEVFAHDAADAGCAAGFVGMLAVRLGGSLVWLREDAAEKQGVLHVGGLVELGIDPSHLILGVLPDPLAVLRAAADVVRCPAVGVAVIEMRRNPAMLDLTAGRRLALAAESSGVTVLLLRIDAQPSPSAADTRWSASAAASAPLEANAPGYPVLDVTLLRQRGRPGDGRWLVEWDRDQASFRAAGAPRRSDHDGARDPRRDSGIIAATVRPAASGTVVSLPVERPAMPHPGFRRVG